nr:DciA family protein [Parafrankia elaeagni]
MSADDAAASAASAARGADLAREMLARAKRDARARDQNRFGPRQGRGAGGPGTTADTVDGPGTGDAGGGHGYGPRRGRRGQERPGDPPPRPRLPGIAPPGREWRTPMAFGSAVARLVAERGWQTQATDASVLARWDALVGPDIAAHCTPVSLRDGELELVAESTAWATQLRMLSRQILGILRRELGPHVVRHITVRGPAAPSWSRGGMSAPGGRGPRDTYG